LQTENEICITFLECNLFEEEKPQICLPELGGWSRQALVCNRVKLWREIASSFGGRSRQALVEDRVKLWWKIASSFGGQARQGLTGIIGSLIVLKRPILP